MKFSAQLLSEISKNKYLSNLPDFKQKKAQELTTIALTLITLSIFGIFAINPTLSTIAQLQREHADNQEVNEKLRQKIVNLGQLQRQYEEIKSDLPIIYGAVPDTPRSSELLAQLQTLGSTSGVDVVRVQTFQADILQSTQQTKTPSFVFSLTAEGIPENIYGFMKVLTDFERITTIDNLIISSGPDASGLLELNVRGRAYYKP